jgi:HD superfamily phosphohydrolase
MYIYMYVDVYIHSYTYAYSRMHTYMYIYIHKGMTSLSSGVTDREDLFNYDDLSPQASEFEPQKHSYKAW